MMELHRGLDESPLHSDLDSQSHHQTRVVTRTGFCAMVKATDTVEKGVVYSSILQL